MKTAFRLFFTTAFFLPIVSLCQNCNNWLRLPSQPSFVRIGDLDIPGNTVTVEAIFNRTAPWSGADVFQGDLVSKHEDQRDCNYLLRPSSAEITTTNGYFKTPVICPIQLNKTYHAALVYDGTTLKFYRNGFLMSQIAASGNLIQNNWQTQIGLYFNQITQENFLGYINEVRIWNIARTQNEIRTYLNQSIPSPTTQTGLLAYYTFNNLLNKQGNATWNGTLNGSASLNQTNPACNIVIDSCNICPKTAFDFGFQQNMCSPKMVQFTTSLPGSPSFQWNFGNGQINNTNQTPSATYTSYGTYAVKLNVQYSGNCPDSLVKTILVDNVYNNNLVVDNDTTICLGDSILLKTNNTSLNYCWQASTGTGPSVLNTYVKPTTTTVYTLTAQQAGTNLVVNGNFSSGNTGFASDYTFAFPNLAEGQYWVGNNPASWNGGFSNCGDHSSGNGNMLNVNGSPVASAKIWSQTINVLPNTNYNFSVWIASLSNTNPANLQFSINNVPLGNSIIANSFTCQWSQFSSAWNSGNNTTAIITVINNNTIAAGNDFVLDDIFFGQVTTVTDSVTVNLAGLCDSIKLSGPNKICSRSDTVTYAIYKSPNCTQQYSVQLDNTYADIIAQTPTSIKLAFKKNGTTRIKIWFDNPCRLIVDSLDVAIQFSPTSIDLGPDISVCRDTSITLHAGAGFSTYLWQGGSTDSTLLVSAFGTYSILTQNMCGAQFKDTLRLTKSSPVPFSADPVTASVCQADSVRFTATGGTVYAWSPATNFNQPNANTSKALVNANQTFTVSIFDPSCQRDTTISIPVIALTAASIHVSKSRDVNCSNDSAILVADGGISYTWTPQSYITRISNGKITVRPPQTTTYYVQGNSASGCTGMDSVTVSFIREGDQKLFVPNAFSPNGDGLNEEFRPIFTGPAARYTFSVYNRWGQLIFLSKTPGIGWNGMYRSTLQPKDVYVYCITAEGGCNGKFEQKGTFVLIR